MRKVFRMRATLYNTNGLKELIAVSLKEKNDVIGIEIGSHSGESADIFMKTGKFSKLFCIDPWKDFDGKSISALTNDLAEKEFDLILKKHPKIQKIKSLSQNTVFLFEEKKR